MITRKSGPFEFIAHHWPPRDRGPVIVFLHGSSMSKEFWEPQIEGLSTAYCPLSLDLPGHGGSDGPGRDSIDGYADAVLDFIAMVVPKGHPLVIGGLSMGGAIVIQLLIRRPDLFDAAILINTGARLKVHPMIFESIGRDFDGFLRSMPSFSLSPHTDVGLFEETILAMVSRCDAETALKDFTACNGFDRMDGIHEITCPTLVFTAEHDVSTPPKYGVWLAEQLKNSERVHIDRAGHFSPLEQPDTVNREISRFLVRSLNL
ncbi:alpha/beta hydrolase [Desulfatiferula olefinivorans]